MSGLFLTKNQTRKTMSWFPPILAVASLIISIALFIISIVYFGQEMTFVSKQTYIPNGDGIKKFDTDAQLGITCAEFIPLIVISGGAIALNVIFLIFGRNICIEESNGIQSFNNKLGIWEIVLGLLSLIGSILLAQLLYSNADLVYEWYGSKTAKAIQTCGIMAGLFIAVSGSIITWLSWTPDADKVTGKRTPFKLDKTIKYKSLNSTSSAVSANIPTTSKNGTKLTAVQQKEQELKQIKLEQKLVEERIALAKKQKELEELTKEKHKEA